MTAVIFDLDGTLIDSAPDIALNANVVLTDLGLPIMPEEQVRSYIGKGVGHLVASLLEASGKEPDGPLFAPTVAQFNTRYETAVENTVIYPGVVDALEKLAAMGCALGICTNKPIAPAMAVLQHLDLAQHFGVVYGGDSFAVRKPDPAPLLAAVKDLGRDHVIYVGDSEVDAQTAVNAKLPFLIYTEGYRKSAVHEMTHDAAFNDYRQLPGLVANMMKG